MVDSSAQFFILCDPFTRPQIILAEEGDGVGGGVGGTQRLVDSRYLTPIQMQRSYEGEEREGELSLIHI